jgi:hypothetical protein
MAAIFTNPRQGQPTEIPDPPLARFLFANRRMAPIWLVVRLYVGWQWFSAGRSETIQAYLAGHAVNVVDVTSWG